MTPATIFAVAYLVGTLVGMPAGHHLPLWLSGAPAWAMAAAAVVVRPLGPTDAERRRAFEVGRFEVGASDRIGERLRRLQDLHAHRVACLALGLFWGAMAGAAATSMPAVLDWLLWPGHDDRGWGVTTATLVALGYLGGAASTDDGAPLLRPGRAGLFLHLVVVTLCALPALWEVL